MAWVEGGSPVPGTGTGSHNACPAAKFIAEGQPITAQAGAGPRPCRGPARGRARLMPPLRPRCGVAPFAGGCAFIVEHVSVLRSARWRNSRFEAVDPSNQIR